MRGEFLAHLIREDGTVADHPLKSRLVALEPSDLAAAPARSASRPGPRRCCRSEPRSTGAILDALVLDEETAGAVLEAMEALQNVA